MDKIVKNIEKTGKKINVLNRYRYEYNKKLNKLYQEKNLMEHLRDIEKLEELKNITVLKTKLEKNNLTVLLTELLKIALPEVINEFKNKRIGDKTREKFYNFFQEVIQSKDIHLTLRGSSWDKYPYDSCMLDANYKNMYSERGSVYIHNLMESNTMQELTEEKIQAIKEWNAGRYIKNTMEHMKEKHAEKIKLDAELKELNEKISKFNQSVHIEHWKIHLRY